VGEHDVFGDRETQAGAPGFAGASFVHAIEAFEQPREVFGSDAGAEVLHEEFHAAGSGAGAKDDASASSPILEGIINQIRKYLMDGFAVGKDRREIFGNGRVLDMQIDAVSAGNLAKASAS
jgi:hypothetical protein